MQSNRIEKLRARKKVLRKKPWEMLVMGNFMTSQRRSAVQDRVNQEVSLDHLL